MHIWGKLIGGFFGFLLSGPFGLILGVFIGHLFDRGLSRNQGWTFSSVNPSVAQQVFFDSTFSVMGHIAKLDGRVSEAEIQAARAIMTRLGLTETMRKKAIDLFNQGKQPSFDLEKTLKHLVQTCHRNKVLLKLFVEIQMQSALAEQPISRDKQKVLQKIYQYLGFAPINFSFFEHIFNFEQAFRQQSSQQQQGGYYQHQSPRSRHQLNLSDAYAILGVSESASPAEIKKAYRKLMSQHHPDKLVSKGLPEEMIKIATEKTQNIKAAYERICAAKGI
ncbi:co-chaperone DjlA [Rickettsiella endosymbiont of Dermanyssus gallinae]|uniref:co-chaperone DjlA n=1 Tax=Rickettsiella endosymbiont of Dermanyssus gallinae TaxID=2856608 RepID=UPI001C529B88|nr:co-chaperone DjlA [Rickettsiella endosymbiont of Dermanyssus gallinae]